jgi:hypothetical protein
MSGEFEGCLVRILPLSPVNCDPHLQRATDFVLLASLRDGRRRIGGEVLRQFTRVVCSAVDVAIVPGRGCLMQGFTVYCLQCLPVLFAAKFGLKMLRWQDHCP